ncbi:tyrosine-type recombinase/integrase [Natrinema sp. 1APR25-10V2]|uniref:tyrosine-type recombinase/integrase n=1 Tax=Natrinema sp. 1APR25-10V2 TaxID=2951081 RepID=UPI002876C5EC|nr:tyrosine-type recombinase/integrase [Natrinema sp. 1APR25-10V2]MDS0474788.1 tyrosine-type recombinase/integrase [Natrinema sp. 1APR25-10V2]
MTASKIKEWVKNDGETPDWVASQPDDVQARLKSYFRATIANNKPNTLKNRATPLKQFSQWYHGNLLEVDSNVVEDWRDDLVVRDYGYRTVRQKIYAISSFYSRLEDRDHIQSNPVDAVDIDHYEKTRQSEHLEQEYVSKDQFQDMLDACETTRECVCCLIFWDCGLRVGEAVDVKLGDINRRKKSIEIETGKTRKMEEDDERTVYYSQKFENVLTEWLDNGKRNSYFGSSGPYLLVSEEAEQMYPGTVSDILRDVADRADVLKEMYTDKSNRTRYWPHPHALRKSYGVYRTKRGMPIAYLSTLMGHSDLQVTRDKYLIFRDDDIRDADRRYRPNLS